MSKRAPHTVYLRRVQEGDRAIFFEQQLDPVANHMAAFSTEDPADREAFASHWDRILAETGITVRTIVADGAVAGHIERFERFGLPEISYWLGNDYWGKGIATQALASFLQEVRERPLYARAAKDNVASLRVLEKCGFAVVGQDKAYANARHQEVEEFLLKMDGDDQAT
ncbi:MAG: GNAT family N-acetyltransferase [Chloroflexota bacterium]